MDLKPLDLNLVVSEKGIIAEPEVDAVDVHRAKTATKSIIADAAKEVEELNKLLHDLRTGTATQKEKDRVQELNEKLSQIKHDIAASKTEERKLEAAYIGSVTRKKMEEVEIAIKEKDIRSAIKAVARAESVDLAFMLDVTGSMSPYIAAVKESISEIIDRVKVTNSNLNMRLAMVAYRDLCDSDQFQVLDFVTSVDCFKSFVNGLEARGGGDGPEDIAGAAKKANGLNWRNSTKVVFLIADAPCHGQEFNDMYDEFPSGAPGTDILVELRKLEAMEAPGHSTLSMTFGKITNDTDKMIHRFRTEGINMDVVDIREISKVTKTVTASVRKSIFKTVGVSGAEGKSVAFAPVTKVKDLLSDKLSGPGLKDVSLKRYTIDPRMPDSSSWSRCPVSVVTVYRNKPVKSIHDVMAPIDVGRLVSMLDGEVPKHDRTDEARNMTMFMKRAPFPFAEGEIRLAYHGRIARKPVDLTEERNSVVLKAFKHLGKGLNDRSQYLKQMEVSTIAKFLADLYNKEGRPSYCAQVHFVPVSVLEEKDDANEENGNRRYCVEDHLPSGGSEFTKYSNNTGYWNEEALNETLLRFTKYTYEITKGYMIVTDLQGVQTGSEFHLTDPVILCKDVLRFGNTNLGPKFIAKCIESVQAHMTEQGLM